MENKEWYNYLKRKYKLSEDDMEEYIDSFNLINKGEMITPNILTKFIKDETGNRDWTNNDSKKIIQQINKNINNHSTFLNLETYLFYIIPICHEYAVTRIGIRELFDSLDTNRDGKITCDELITILYEVNHNFTLEEMEQYKIHIKNLCKKVDTNQDGYISYDEFKTFMINMNQISNS